MLLYHDTRAPTRAGSDLPGREGCGLRHDRGLDRRRGAPKPEFRKKNPLALLPVLELADGKIARVDGDPAATSRSCTPSPTCSAPTRGSARDRAVEPPRRARAADPDRPGVPQHQRVLDRPDPAVPGVRRDHARAGGQPVRLVRRASSRSGPTLAGLAVHRRRHHRAVRDRLRQGVQHPDQAETHPHLAAWHARVSERPSARA